jgi:hypothetical protein
VSYWSINRGEKIKRIYYVWPPRMVTLPRGGTSGDIKANSLVN